MVEECDRLDPSGTRCLQYPSSGDRKHVIIITVLPACGFVLIGAVILITILRHQAKKKKTFEAQAKAQSRVGEVTGAEP